MKVHASVSQTAQTPGPNLSVLHEAKAAERHNFDSEMGMGETRVFMWRERM